MDAASTRYAYGLVGPPLEAVTLGVRTGDDGPAVYSEYQMLAKRGRAKSDLTGTPSRGRHWQLWQALMDAATAVSPATLPCPAPRVGDRITDATGGKWAIATVDEALFGNVFLCECVQDPS